MLFQILKQHFSLKIASAISAADNYFALVKFFFIQTTAFFT